MGASKEDRELGVPGGVSKEGYSRIGEMGGGGGEGSRARGKGNSSSPVVESGGGDMQEAEPGETPSAARSAITASASSIMGGSTPRHSLRMIIHKADRSRAPRSRIKKHGRVHAARDAERARPRNRDSGSVRNREDNRRGGRAEGEKQTDRSTPQRGRMYHNSDGTVPW